MCYHDREELLSFAHEALLEMLSYNVDRYEAYLYLTNRLDLVHASYELQCCVYEEDPITYLRECDKVKNMSDSDKREQNIKYKPYGENNVIPRTSRNNNSEK